MIINTVLDGINDVAAYFAEKVLFAGHVWKNFKNAITLNFKAMKQENIEYANGIAQIHKDNAEESEKRWMKFAEKTDKQLSALNGKEKSAAKVVKDGKIKSLAEEVKDEKTIKKEKAEWEKEQRKLNNELIKGDLDKQLADVDENLREQLERYNQMLEEKKISNAQYDEATKLATAVAEKQKMDIIDKQRKEAEKGNKEMTEAMQKNFQIAMEGMAVNGKSFGDSMTDVYTNIKKEAIKALSEMIMKEIERGTVAKAEAMGEGQAKAVAGYAGMPFVGLLLGLAASAAVGAAISAIKFEKGGIVGAPTLGLMGENNKKEAIIPLESATGKKLLGIGDNKGSSAGAAGGVIIQRIDINFPNVQSFQEWLDADPKIIKNVVEKKLLQAFAQLSKEGKMDAITRVNNI